MNNPMYAGQSKEAHPMGGDVKTICQRYMNYHVIAQTRDGSQFDGIIDGMDDDGVIMLVPEEVEGAARDDEAANRQFGYGPGRFRRFNRFRFPFFYFAFPFFRPYPYYPYPYPYPYPYYPGYGYGGGY